MVTFIALLDFTEKGIQSIKDSPYRADQFNEMAEKAGARVVAQYWTIEVDGRRSERAAWSYLEPTPAFRPIKNCLAFYPARVDECWVGEHRVQAQEGTFYGGWITPWIVGPFKGGPNTHNW